tara:strand:- start:2137 stop:2799 length:663 start_codon:yes stop_codon:yes gene_type:complete
LKLFFSLKFFFIGKAVKFASPLTFRGYFGLYQNYSRLSQEGHNIYNHKNTYFLMVEGEEKEEEVHSKEEVLKVSNSRKLYIPIYTMIIVLVSVVFFLKYFGEEINNLAFNLAVVFSIVALIGTEANRFMNTYEINPQSLVHRRGIFVQTTKTVDLTAVSDADSKQNLFQKLFNYGNVSVHLFSRDGAIPINHINNPKRFVNFLEEKMNAKRLKSEGGINK